nr:protein cereblon [Hymenolepis microstoma]
MSTDSDSDSRFDEMSHDVDSANEYVTVSELAEGSPNLGSLDILMDTGSHISESDINFDRSLPGLHTYLGGNSMSIDSGNYQEPGTMVTLRAIYRHGIVLIPGYTLPLKTANTSEQQVIDFYCNPVAVLPGSIQFNKYTSPDKATDFVNQIATIAHLVSVRVDGPNYNPILLGRQRLRILDIYLNSQDHYRYCTGLVLPENVDDEMQCPVSRLSIPYSLCRFARDPEFVPSPPSSNDQPPSDESRSLPFPRPGDPFAALCSRINSNSGSSNSGGGDGETFNQRQLPHLPCRRDVMATLACNVSSIPPWIFHQYDLSYIVGQIRAKLSRWTNTWQMEKWNPCLAVPFSYWLIQNLPLTFTQKADFLKLDPVVARLRACLNFIETCSGLACAQCRTAISSQTNVICLTDEGSVQAYVNPHGFIFDMLTLSIVYQGSISLVGTPTTEYSWFPG